MSQINNNADLLHTREALSYCSFLSVLKFSRCIQRQRPRRERKAAHFISFHVKIWYSKPFNSSLTNQWVLPYDPRPQMYIPLIHWAIIHRGNYCAYYMVRMELSFQRLDTETSNCPFVSMDLGWTGSTLTQCLIHTSWIWAEYRLVHQIQIWFKIIIDIKVRFTHNSVIWIIQSEIVMKL